MFTKEHIEIIKNGGVGVIPTDTQYGLIASSHNKGAVDRLINIKGITAERKGFVNLISKIEDLKEMDIEPSEIQRDVLQKLWPGPFSIIFKVNKEHQDILRFSEHPFRLPNYKELIDFVSRTGPIIATSANITNQPAATDIKTAKEYFGKKVDFYIDGGVLDNDPSTILMIRDNQIKVIREGKGDISLLIDDNIDIIK